ncbi:hypothetical protein SEA_TOMAS_107 [Streptomyces phage Tomas]|uniref:Uncharacterized protein n=1 Tax=Streptomyces phage Tomas TaxID=2914443 RepID=A0AA49H3Q2_9CAUD|nr:hypothetical protein PP453_gp175 [Streptomyces phage Tomas]UMO76292.1 hypothetical protein SEA_TOMAS_107 [Streptomyces phage Tomas]
MGYYTDFSLTAEGSGPVYEKMMAERHKITFSHSNYDFTLGTWLDRDYSDNLKWYEHEEDMKTLSSEWPNVLFILEGDGEEAGDMWKAWFRNGHMYKLTAKIVFETTKPDLDKYLPYDHNLEKELAERYKRELQDQIDELKRRLDGLA